MQDCSRAKNWQRLSQVNKQKRPFGAFFKKMVQEIKLKKGRYYEKAYIMKKDDFLSKKIQVISFSEIKKDSTIILSGLTEDVKTIIKAARPDLKFTSVPRRADVCISCSIDYSDSFGVRRLICTDKEKNIFTYYEKGESYFCTHSSTLLIVQIPHVIYQEIEFGDRVFTEESFSRISGLLSSPKMEKLGETVLYDYMNMQNLELIELLNVTKNINHIAPRLEGECDIFDEMPKLLSHEWESVRNLMKEYMKEELQIDLTGYKLVKE